MILEIAGIRDKGNFEKERVVIRVRENGDIGNYILSRTKLKSTNSVSSQIKDPLWFPNKLMKADDIVVVYTKQGNNRDRENDDHSHSYFLYWGLDRAVWSNDSIPILMEVSTWDIYNS